ncbi:hypothetical protein GIB67_040359 [Kingdonia uniflora]|uniref:Uncharacterized protein n=1 Tax=Kingdonia uniflora TaxID=39325 RepID=A0A7J7L9F4_9MAGN|nr:hypothetical protein GIB67_040359 [Kingdonia uniflora]
MVKLYEDDPKEASKEMKRSMFQVKVLKRDLEAITNSFNESHEHQRSKQKWVWVAKLAVKEREKVEQKMQEGDAYVIGGADGGTGGGVEASVIEAISVKTVDGVVVDGLGSKLSTGGSESAGAAGPVGEKDAALPI